MSTNLRKYTKGGMCRGAGAAIKARVLKVYSNGTKKMVQRKMGRHWGTEEEWKNFNPVEGNLQVDQKKVPKMRPTCKSHTNDKVRKGLCCQQKKK